MSSPAGVPQLREVRLLGLPLPLYRKAQAHHAELTREFAFVANPHPDTDQQVPARLLALVADLRSRFGAFTAGPTGALESALARGDAEIDVTFHVPVAVRDAAVEFAALLDEADEYCRHGDLLTLETPADAVAFRRWYLGEFVAQIDGGPPTPWPAYE